MTGPYFPAPRQDGANTWDLTAASHRPAIPQEGSLKGRMWRKSQPPSAMIGKPPEIPSLRVVFGELLAGIQIPGCGRYT